MTTAVKFAAALVGTPPIIPSYPHALLKDFDKVSDHSKPMGARESLFNSVKICQKGFGIRSYRRVVGDELAARVGLDTEIL